jgi:hypothetical protein
VGQAFCLPWPFVDKLAASVQQQLRMPHPALEAISRTSAPGNER